MVDTLFDDSDYSAHCTHAGIRLAHACNAVFQGLKKVSHACEMFYKVFVL